MNFIKTTMALLLLLGTLALGASFEQNGVKEGNSKVSISFLGSIDDNDKVATTFQVEYGYFFNNNIETLMKITGNTNELFHNLEIYTVGLGANFYFLKTPTLTPYIGATVFHYNYGADLRDKETNRTKRYDNSLNGGEIHIGTHYFLNEHTAITPEIGSHYLDFEDHSQTYFNVMISYMF